MCPIFVGRVCGVCGCAFLRLRRHPDRLGRTESRLTDYATGDDLDGYVWGVKWHSLYPGGKVRPKSAIARQWRDAVGIDFHEIVIETNAHKLTLICADLTVGKTGPGGQRRRPGCYAQRKDRLAVTVGDLVEGHDQAASRRTGRLEPHPSRIP